MYKYVKTNELSGYALDWAVAKCVGYQDEHFDGVEKVFRDDEDCWFEPSTNWAQGGPIIAKAKIEVFIRDEEWLAYSSLSIPEDFSGETPLIAAMRCFVAAHMGSSVSVPVELLEVN